MSVPIISEKLQKVLAASSAEDELVESLTSQFECTVFRALFYQKEQSPLEAEVLRDSLHKILHWSVHVGQAAWALLNPSPEVSGYVDRIAVHDLLVRPFIMLWQEGSEIIDVIYHHSSRLNLLDLHRSDLHTWEKSSTFSRTRLYAGSSNRTLKADPTGGETLAMILCNLRQNATLYVEFLDWLVSHRRKRRGEISDCFSNLCALALSMSGDALRLLFPA